MSARFKPKKASQARFTPRYLPSRPLKKTGIGRTSISSCAMRRSSRRVPSTERTDAMSPCCSIHLPGAGRARAIVGDRIAVESLLDEVLLFLHVLPVVGIRGRGLALDDRFPDLRELRVQRDEFLLRGRHVVLREDRFDRAFGHAQRAVD